MASPVPPTTLPSQGRKSAASWRSRAFHAIVVCAASIVLLAAYAQHDGKRPSEQPSSSVQFRSGVELISVDVAVLGPDGVPVRGLQGADFDVLVDGTSRQVVSLQFLAAETQALGPAQNPSSQSERSQRAPAAPDDPFPGRRFLLLIDRDSMPFGRPVRPGGARPFRGRASGARQSGGVGGAGQPGAPQLQRQPRDGEARTLRSIRPRTCIG